MPDVRGGIPIWPMEKQQRPFQTSPLFWTPAPNSLTLMAMEASQSMSCPTNSTSPSAGRPISIKMFWPAASWHILRNFDPDHSTLHNKESRVKKQTQMIKFLEAEKFPGLASVYFLHVTLTHWKKNQTFFLQLFILHHSQFVIFLSNV